MATYGGDVDVTWEQIEPLDFFWIVLMVAAAIWPFISAALNKTSVALAMVLSLLLVHFIKYALAIFNSPLFSFEPIHLFSMIPAIYDVSASESVANSHRFVTAAWLHADFIHVLGNVLVIALAGVPLEQRLGPKRWIAVYFLGIFGGNIAWVATHPGSITPAIGASGAAFGLLGAYMACWPDDKIEFPLLFLIRAWPVWSIAFVRLGLEIFQMYSIQSGTAGESNIAHMAHIGGFFLAYVLARPIARGAPSSLFDSSEVLPGEYSSRSMKTSQMGSLDSDPWSESDKELSGNSARILAKLREEGDELETRRAWLEELAENVICPVCEGEVFVLVENENSRLKCFSSTKHIDWP